MPDNVSNVTARVMVASVDGYDRVPTIHEAKNWLLVIEGDVSPYLIGPMDEADLLPAAREHRAEDPSAEDGLYHLTLDANGELTIGSFGGEELGGEQ
jgi:hypothetical protein